MAAPYLGCHNVLAELGAPVLPPLPLQGAQERITYLDELLKSHLDLHRDVRGRWVFLSHKQTKVRKESSLTWVTISFFLSFFFFSLSLRVSFSHRYYLVQFLCAESFDPVRFHIGFFDVYESPRISSMQLNISIPLSFIS